MMAHGVAPLTRTRRLRHFVLRGFVVGVVLAGLVHAVYVLLGPNFYTVIPGQVYRSAQLDASTLRWFMQQHHVRTVLNLRGCSDPTPWYLAECRATSDLDVALEDVSLSAGRLPPIPAIRHIIEILDNAERPLLIHCNKGIDRTGMVSTMALLLYTDANLDDAREQLGPLHGHLPLGRTGNIDRFFDLYAEWLAVNGLHHERENFRHWSLNEYCPGECRATIEVLESTVKPLRLTRGKSFAVRVRCTNTSVKPWVLRPEKNAGVHVRFLLLDADDVQIDNGLAGLFHCEVEPGGSIDLTLAIPPIREPGRYLLRVDMLDAQGTFFFQYGHEPLFLEVNVP